MEMIQKLGSDLKQQIEKESIERKMDKALLMGRINSLAGETAENSKAGQKHKIGTPDEPPVFDGFIQRLKEGNTRFVNGKPSVKNLPKQREELIAGQQPYAIILGCSDSRVSPELVFDESLGQLFIVRDAGNVADSVTLGSIEYAAEHLHAKLLVVLGHTSCGAVKATLAGGELPPNIGAIANRIAPAADKAKARHLGEKETALAASSENVRMQIDACIEQSTLLRELVDKDELKIVGAIYNLETGKVEFQ
jgi:carbonic anhydrase